MNDPRPVQLMNTIWVSRNQVNDDLRTVEGLTTWLGFEVTERDLAQFRTLRQALRDLAAVITADTRPIAENRDTDRAVAELNSAAKRATQWPQLTRELHRTNESPDTAADRALAATAAEAIELFTGPERESLRACNAPGCVLYFVKDHPRREWCSPVCGNRVRAARHYRRNRDND